MYRTDSRPSEAMLYLYSDPDGRVDSSVFTSFYYIPSFVREGLSRNWKVRRHSTLSCHAALYSFGISELMRDVLNGPVDEYRIAE